MTELTPGGSKRPVFYKKYAAQGIVNYCRSIGVVLLVEDGRIKCFPRRALDKRTSIRTLIAKYAREIATLLTEDL